MSLELEPGMRLERKDYGLDVVSLAHSLLGCLLVSGPVSGQIVETEAYHECEASCHAHRGRTRRTEVLFWPPGHLYVYRIHRSFCLNVTAEAEGVGAAVLIRALEPYSGLEVIEQRRGGRPRPIWTDGPGKICQALAINTEQNGTDLCHSPAIYLSRQVQYGEAELEITPRIGISQATQLPWRFVVPASRRKRQNVGALLAAPSDMGANK